MQRSAIFSGHSCMKTLFVVLFCLAVTTAFGQVRKPIALSTTARFNVTVDGLANHDAGYGVGIDASFFSKHRLQLLVESSADRFIGDKLLVVDPGKEAKKAAAFALRAGPQFFFSKRLALSATYGPSWHVVHDFSYSVDGSYSYGLTGFAGNKGGVIVKLFGVTLPKEGENIQYVGLAVGFKF